MELKPSFPVKLGFLRPRHLNDIVRKYFPILGFVDSGWGALHLQVKVPNETVHTYFGLGCQMSGEGHDHG